MVTYFGRKGKTRKKSNDAGTEKKTVKCRNMKKGKGESIAHQEAMC